MVNFENGASGKTPVNKTNLNKMQTDLQTSLTNLEDKVEDFYLEAVDGWTMLSDAKTETITLEANTLYLLFNSHVNTCSAYVICYFNSQSLEYFKTYQIFGANNISFSHDGAKVTVSTTGPCRGRLFKIRPFGCA